MKFCFSSLLAAGLFLIYRLIRRTLAPLNGLAGQIRGRRTEEPERPLAVPDSGDEVAEMARAFTQMSGQLNQVFVMQKTSPVSSSLLFPPSEGRYHGNGLWNGPNIRPSA